MDGVVDFGRTARRMRRVLLVAGVGLLTAWPVVGWMRGTGLSVALLGELVGWAVLLAVVGEFVVVGGAALRGLLRAGGRGHRLASDDVAIIPPQLFRRPRRDGDPASE
ncbi:MAG: hypothetical protein WD575_04775 [Nitriliruptoraceae bacterium]